MNRSVVSRKQKNCADVQVVGTLSACAVSIYSTCATVNIKLYMIQQGSLPKKCAIGAEERSSSSIWTPRLTFFTCRFCEPDKPTDPPEEADFPDLDAISWLISQGFPAWIATSGNSSCRSRFWSAWSSWGRRRKTPKRHHCFPRPAWTWNNHVIVFLILKAFGLVGSSVSQSRFGKPFLDNADLLVPFASSAAYPLDRQTWCRGLAPLSRNWVHFQSFLKSTLLNLSPSWRKDRGQRRYQALPSSSTKIFFHWLPCGTPQVVEAENVHSIEEIRQHCLRDRDHCRKHAAEGRSWTCFHIEDSTTRRKKISRWKRCQEGEPKGRKPWGVSLSMDRLYFVALKLYLCCDNKRYESSRSRVCESSWAQFGRFPWAFLGCRRSQNRWASKTEVPQMPPSILSQICQTLISVFTLLQKKAQQSSLMLGRLRQAPLQWPSGTVSSPLSFQTGLVLGATISSLWWFAASRLVPLSRRRTTWTRWDMTSCHWGGARLIYFVAGVNFMDGLDQDLIPQRLSDRLTRKMMSHIIIKISTHWLTRHFQFKFWWYLFRCSHDLRQSVPDIQGVTVLPHQQHVHVMQIALTPKENRHLK